LIVEEQFRETNLFRVVFFVKLGLAHGQAMPMAMANDFCSKQLLQNCQQQQKNQPLKHVLETVSGKSPFWKSHLRKKSLTIHGEAIFSSFFFEHLFP